MATGMDEWRRPALGAMRGGRPRPTYVIGVREEWQQANYFPKSNWRKLRGTGCSLAWRLSAWDRVDGSVEGIRQREVHCAVFDGDAIVCFIELQQIKNADEEVFPADLRLTMDDDSAELGEMGEVLVEAIAEDPEHFWLVAAGEVFTEVHSLFITPPQRGKMVWAQAIRRILEILDSKQNSDADYMLAVLKPMPLEVWSVRSDRNRAARERGDEPQDDSQSEERLFQRRKRALIRLYEKELGFTLLPESGWMWCAVQAGW